MSLILSGTDGLSDVDGTAATPAIRGTDANTGIFFPAADTIAFSEGGAEVARFDSSGNFGIGTSSPSTYGKLVSLGTDNATLFAAVGATNMLRVQGYNSTYVGTVLEAVNLAQSANTPLFINGSTLKFGINGTTQTTIDSSGNVGIGTSSPILGLTIKNDTGSTTYGQRAGSLVLESNNVTAGGGTDVVWSIGTQTNQRYASIGSAIEGNDGAGGARGSIAFATKAASATTTLTERMRIDSSGNLLVGTTSSLGTLAGATNASGFIYGPTDALVLATNNSNANLIINRTNSNTAGRVLSVRYNGSEIGSISLNGTNTAFNTSSDYRLKNTIAPMTGALAKVALLKPCTYKWNVNGSDGQGFIAHELDEVISGCVTGEKDAVDAEGNPVYQGVDTSFLVATLTAAIQEQQALITSLTTRITALEAK